VRVRSPVGAILFLIKRHFTLRYEQTQIKTTTSKTTTTKQKHFIQDRNNRFK
jgi:hypothetical protein